MEFVAKMENAIIFERANLGSNEMIMAMMLMTFDEGKQHAEEGYTEDQKDLIARQHALIDSDQEKLRLYIERRNELIVKIALRERVFGCIPPASEQ
ncbi:hypothetical protein A2U01_0008220 [Trifolium medium]|uniref:Uncharacterized protein n=1 Tax=Trifolium medium TaxID=97028 RepID=A0A392MIM4_9FABA|nr:hypothetical protein [Trifolium medium]